MTQTFISSMTAKWMAKDLNQGKHVKIHLKCLLDAHIDEDLIRASGLDQAVIRHAVNEKYSRKVKKVMKKYPSAFASMKKKEMKKKEVKPMLTICTASWIARDFKKNKNFKSHLRQLFKANITAEALKKSGLEEQLNRHFNHPKYWQLFQRLLEKYSTICADEREIHQQQMNKLMENLEKYSKKEICPISALFHTENSKPWTPPSYDNDDEKMLSELDKGVLVKSKKRPSPLAEVNNGQNLEKYPRDDICPFAALFRTENSKPTAKVPKITDEEKELLEAIRRLEEEIGGY